MVRPPRAGDALLSLALGALLVSPLAAQRAGEVVGGERRGVIARAAARVAPAVVSVSVVKRERALPRDIFEQMMMPRGMTRRVEGLGTGILVGADGLILTNQHVTGGADSIVVTLRDGRDFQARLLGEDDRTDVAVLKVDASGLPVAPLGRSRDLVIGDWVVAIGNPYGFLLGNTEPTVTAGVVSALGRDVLPGEGQSGLYVDMIQTDAAINPGNSGGPLVNADGEVVGVNAFILSQSGGSVGLGFAIPIERAMRVAGDLRRLGHVRRGWVGVEVDEAPQSTTWRHQSGVVVQRVAPGGPGYRLLKQGDRIEQVGGEVVRNFLTWEKVLLDLAPGDTLRLLVRRGEEAREVAVVAAALPSASAARVNLRDLTLITVTPAIQAERQLATGQGALVVAAGPTWQSALAIQPGDVIVQINNYPIRSAEQVGQVVSYLQGRTAMRFFFVRGDQVIYTDLWGTP
jgi:serine protease Do